MGTQEFFSENDSETMADALKAVGLAEVFRAWLGALGRDQARIEIVDHESHYTIKLPSPLGQEDIALITSPFMAGRGRLLMSGKQIQIAQQRVRTRSLPEYLYDEFMEQRNRYFALRDKLSPSDRVRFNKAPADFPEIQSQTPNPDLDLYIYINHFKAASNYNELLWQWAGNGDLEVFRCNLGLILTIFAQQPNALATAEDRWDEIVKTNANAGKRAVTRVQSINPASGKGINAPKANNASPGNVDGFWLIEALKFFGLFTITAPRMVAMSKDRKTYVLRPTRVELEPLRDVMTNFRSRLYATTAVKLDIMAVLQFTSRLIEYQRDALAARGVNPFLAMFGHAPRVTDIARGFDITSYKDMGSAYATMNLATINLPDWLEPATSVEGADAVIALLEEHRQVVSSIQSAKGDEGSEEFELLRRYRDFLSGHDPNGFFAFAAHYGDYYLGKRHHNQWGAQLTTDGMETFVAQQKSHYGDILKTEGFIAIARAIRQATVLAQYHSARENRFPFEVRYGLGQDLLRAAAYPEDFIKALNRFMQSFNAENARIDERVAKKALPNLPRNRRASIKTEHIDDIVGLVDRYNGDSELICTMLVAYGYARDPRTPGAPTASETGEGEHLDNGEPGDDSMGSDEN